MIVEEARLGCCLGQSDGLRPGLDKASSGNYFGLKVFQIQLGHLLSVSLEDLITLLTKTLLWQFAFFSGVHQINTANNPSTHTTGGTCFPVLLNKSFLRTFCILFHVSPCLSPFITLNVHVNSNFLQEALFGYFITC